MGLHRSWSLNYATLFTFHEFITKAKPWSFGDSRKFLRWEIQCLSWRKVGEEEFLDPNEAPDENQVVAMWFQWISLQKKKNGQILVSCGLLVKMTCADLSSGRIPDPDPCIGSQPPFFLSTNTSALQCPALRMTVNFFYDRRVRYFETLLTLQHDIGGYFWHLYLNQPIAF